jgi:predicted transcriptional regulator
MPKISDIAVHSLIRPSRLIPKGMEISEALRLFREEKADFLSVVDGDDRLIGAVSENSFMKLVRHDSPSPMGDAVWSDHIEPHAGKQPVEAIMTRDITTIGPHEDLAAALKVMSSSYYKLLHVVDHEGKLMGVIRMHDIFERLLGVK